MFAKCGLLCYSAVMAKTFKEMIKDGKTRSFIKKELQNGKLFRIQRGLYSEKKTIVDIEKISELYKNAIFCSYSAFYFHGISNVIPDYYYLAIGRDATKIRHEMIKLSFFSAENLDIGATTMIYDGVKIKIYDKERMLIDLVRLRNNYDQDYYKDTINYYRNHMNQIDTIKIENYAHFFRDYDFIMRTINKEVF